MPTTIVIAPGQGAQRPRMLLPWVRDTAAAALLREWSHQADIDLIRLGTTAPPGEIARTENTQPLLVAQALLAMAEVTAETIAVAGHSVGELAAAAMAGAVAPGEAVRLGRLRGLAMAEACNTAPTSMAAVLGGDPSTVAEAIRAAGASVANRNGAGQLVAAGSAESIGQLVRTPPRGSAVKRLAVSGAFHTPYMQPALAPFRRALDESVFHDTSIPIIQNLDGRAVSGGSELRDRLARQIAAPVRWDLCLDTIEALGPELVVAAPPGRTLSGIVRRRSPALPVTCITAPRDLTRKA